MYKKNCQNSERYLKIQNSKNLNWLRYSYWKSHLFYVRNK